MCKVPENSNSTVVALLTSNWVEDNGEYSQTVAVPFMTVDAKVVNVDYFNGKINTRGIEKDPDTGEEVFSQEIRSYTKEEIKRIGKNGKKPAGDTSVSEDIDDAIESGDLEEIRELEELMREF